MSCPGSVERVRPMKSVLKTTRDQQLAPQVPAKRVKKLTASARREIELKNHARKLAGLSPIVIKVRTCNRCSKQFESSGNRNCGCQSKRSGFIAGREII